MRFPPYLLLLLALSMALPSIVFSNPGGVAIFSPSGAIVATPGADCTVNIWDVASGNKIKSLYTPISRQMRLVSELVWTPLISFSPDGKVLATKRGGDPINVWNVQDWSNLGSLKAKGVITNFKLSPGSRLLAMMSVDNKTVRSPIGIAVWEIASGKTVLQIRQTEDTPLTEWSFSLDGRLIMLRLRSGGIKLWNIERA